MPLSAITQAHWSDIIKLQAEVYSQVEPEPLSVLQSKWQQSPECCFVYLKNNRVLGYLLAHAWHSESPPKLAQALAIDSQGPILFLHDLAISKQLAGQGIGRKMVNHLFNTVAPLHFEKTKLVAIQKTTGFWQKMGFTEVNNQKACGSYGDNATVMQRQTR